MHSLNLSNYNKNNTLYWLFKLYRKFFFVLYDMQCKLEIRTESDRLYLVDTAKFEPWLDCSDIQEREASQVIDQYHRRWFRDEGQERWFTPPAFEIRDRWIYFINGRHRTELLMRHLPRFPVLITAVIGDGGDEILQQFALEELEWGAEFELPDFPLSQDFPPP